LTRSTTQPPFDILHALISPFPQQSVSQPYTVPCDDLSPRRYPPRHPSLHPPTLHGRVAKWFIALVLQGRFLLPGSLGSRRKLPRYTRCPRFKPERDQAFWGSTEIRRGAAWARKERSTRGLQGGGGQGVVEVAWNPFDLGRISFRLADAAEHLVRFDAVSMEMLQRSCHLDWQRGWQRGKMISDQRYWVAHRSVRHG
jgi:hypothetical protein